MEKTFPQILDSKDVNDLIFYVNIIRILFTQIV